MRLCLTARNVQEFVASGRTMQVIGPAVFSGELPTAAPVSGRLESGRVRGGIFEWKLSGLVTNAPHIIESACDVTSGSWAPVDAFIARACWTTSGQDHRASM